MGILLLIVGSMIVGACCSIFIRVFAEKGKIKSAVIIPIICIIGLTMAVTGTSINTKKYYEEKAILEDGDSIILNENNLNKSIKK